MTVRRRERFVFATTGWLLATAFVLSLLSELRPDLFIVCLLVGVFVVPEWRRRIRWVFVAGLVVFAHLVGGVAGVEMATMSSSGVPVR